MASNSMPSRRPSDAEWSAHLPRICELYYGQRCTLEDTQRILQQEKGFYATLRMYKDRIRNMAVHPKKICMQKYQAMNIVAEDYQHRGISTYFVGPSGFQLFRRTPAQITKQLRRPHSLHPITLEEAHTILRQSSIQAVIEHAVPIAHGVLTVPREGPDSNLSLPPLSEMLETTNDSPPPAYNQSDDELLRRPSSQARTGSLPIIPVDGIQGQHKTIWESSQSHRLSRPLTQPFAEPRTHTISLAGIKLQPERLLKPPTISGEDDSYDFISDFEDLSMNGSREPLPPRSQITDCMLPPPSATHRRRMATECAAPFFLSCFPPAPSATTFEYSKTAAMDKFRFILTTTPENQYVLPLLNWMGTVLASNGKGAQLKDFVAECCQVLDSCNDYGFPLSTPYRYMLAFCCEDQAAMALHGSHFALGTERLTQLYGSSHPNVLVNEYYRAWHEMSSPNGWSNARATLESCLSKSERVLGHSNLMTINCLAVLGRGFAENGLHNDARSIFKDSLDRLGSPAEPLQAYRLMILQRLAFEDEQIGDLQSAELQHRQVYEGRLQCLSAFSPETKAAMCSLADLLRRHGRQGEATAIEQHYDIVFEQAYQAKMQRPMTSADQQSLAPTTSSGDLQPPLGVLGPNRS